MRRSILPSLLPSLLLALTAVGCSDGESTILLGAEATCAAPPELSVSPVVMAGDWWNAGAMPPTLHVEQQGTALRGELAFSGVIRRDGTGRVDGGCLTLTFPGRAGTAERPLVVHGMLLTPTRLRIALENEDPAVDPLTFVLERRPVAP
ncbi:MAG: hypothetical protein ACXWZS_05235 [Gemmatirosa sp.]